MSQEQERQAAVSALMTTERLYTKDDGLVAEVPIPRFQPPAEAIVWGARLFLRAPDGRYREGFAYFAAPADVQKEG